MHFSIMHNLLKCSNSTFIVTVYADAVFLAALTNDDSTDGVYIFEESVINSGGHYDNTSGTYRAPYDGFYLFGVQLQTSSTSSNIGTQIRVNGTIVYADTAENGNYKPVTLILELTAGQVVDVYKVGVDTTDGEPDLLRSYFFGYLINTL